MTRFACWLAVAVLATSVSAEPIAPKTRRPKPSLPELLAHAPDVVLIQIDGKEIIRIGGRVTEITEIDTIGQIASLPKNTAFIIEAAKTVPPTTVDAIRKSLTRQDFWRVKSRLLEPPPKREPTAATGS